MNYRTSFYIKEIGSIAGLVLILIAVVLKMELLAWIGVIIEAAAILQILLFYKCPYCGQRFEMRTRKVPKYCPECGRDLN